MLWSILSAGWFWLLMEQSYQLADALHIFAAPFRPSQPLLDRSVPDFSSVTSVEDWLSAIQMSQYRDNLLRCGFDSLPLVAEMTSEWVCRHCSASCLLTGTSCLCPVSLTFRLLGVRSPCLISCRRSRLIVSQPPVSRFLLFPVIVASPESSFLDLSELLFK